MQRVSIRTKLVLSTCIPVLVIYGLIGLLGYRTLKSEAIEAKRQLAESLAAHYASRFEGEIGQIAHIRNTVYGFVGDQPQDDDLTVVAIKKSDSE